MELTLEQLIDLCKTYRYLGDGADVITKLLDGEPAKDMAGKGLMTAQGFLNDIMGYSKDRKVSAMSNRIFKELGRRDYE